MMSQMTSSTDPMRITTSGSVRRARQRPGEWEGPRRAGPGLSCGVGHAALRGGSPPDAVLAGLQADGQACGGGGAGPADCFGCVDLVQRGAIGRDRGKQLGILALACARTAQRSAGAAERTEPVNPDETSGGLVLVWCHLRFDGRGGLVDPDSGGQPRWLGWLPEPAGAGGVGLLEDAGAACLDLGGGAVVDGCGGVQADA